MLVGISSYHKIASLAACLPTVPTARVDPKSQLSNPPLSFDNCHVAHISILIFRGGDSLLYTVELTANVYC